MARKPIPIEQQLYDAALEVLRKADGDRRRRIIWATFELGPARHALRRATESLAQNDNLGHLLWFRLIAEIAIRLSWAARHLPDERRTIAAVNMLMKRDALNMQAAAKATSGGKNPSAERILTELRDLAPAPRQVDELASAADSSGLYKWFRLCSALVHPGGGMSTVGAFPADTSQIHVREFMLVCLAEVVDLFNAMGLATLPDETVDGLAADDHFSVSAIVLALQVQRALRRSTTGRRVRVTDSSFDIRMEGNDWTHTAEVRLRTSAGLVRLESTTTNADMARDEVIRQAVGLR